MTVKSLLILIILSLTLFTCFGHIAGTLYNAYNVTYENQEDFTNDIKEMGSTLGVNITTGTATQVQVSSLESITTFTGAISTFFKSIKVFVNGFNLFLKTLTKYIPIPSFIIIPIISILTVVLVFAILKAWFRVEV